MAIRYKAVESITGGGGGGGGDPVNQNVVHVDATFGNDGTAVKNDASKPYATIEAGLTAAASGDTILVYPGTYVAVDTGSGRWLDISSKPINIHCMDGVIWDITTNQATVTDVIYASDGPNFSLTGYLETTIPTAQVRFCWLANYSNSGKVYIEAKEIHGFSNTVTDVLRIYSSLGQTATFEVKANVTAHGSAVYTMYIGGNFKYTGNCNAGSGICYLPYPITTAFDVELSGNFINSSAVFPTVSTNQTQGGTATLKGRLENTLAGYCVDVTGSSNTVLDDCTLVTAGTFTVDSVGGLSDNVYCYNAMLNAPITANPTIVVPNYTVDSNII